MAKDRRSDFSPPIYHGDQDDNIRAAKPTPLTTGSDHNRGHRARGGSGVVEGSGAGAGGGGNPEEYDSDPVSGGNAEDGEDMSEQQNRSGGRDDSDLHDAPPATGQSGFGGGNIARDIGSRDEERAVDSGAPEPTRATKQDKNQPDTGTRSDHEGAQKP
ncbi:MAG TPA: hypothetical protein VJM09_03710 [Sphingobium sp.]|nr:hypothetical protein [Sphingobium sp.]